MATYHIRIHAHKSTAQVAGQDGDGKVVETRRLPTEEFESFAKEYEALEARLAALEARLAALEARVTSMEIGHASPAPTDD